MNSRTKINHGRRILTPRWREIWSRPGRNHDPMLVLNMSIFNFTGGWMRTFNQLKVHENGT